jgi:hypothetical protein
VIDDDIFAVECGPDGKVISAVMAIQISGGIAPYELKFDPGDTTIPNIQEGAVVRFTLQAGHSLTTTVKSHSVDGNPTGLRDIRAPSADAKCDEPTPTGVPSATITNTPVPPSVPPPLATRTKRDDPDPTETIIVISSPTDPGAIPSDTPSTPVNKTNTPSIPVIKTNTPSTSIVKTNTPSTPIIKTNTPSTPAIKTDTPRVRVTFTPLPPKFGECEDGRDNDGDKLIDLADPQCKSKNDNHEGK